MSVHSPTEAVPPTDGLTVESLPSPPPEMPTFSQEPSGKAPHHEPPRVKLVPESGTAVESGVVASLTAPLIDEVGVTPTPLGSRVPSPAVVVTRSPDTASVPTPAPLVASAGNPAAATLVGGTTIVENGATRIEGGSTVVISSIVSVAGASAANNPAAQQGEDSFDIVGGSTSIEGGTTVVEAGSTKVVGGVTHVTDDSSVKASSRSISRSSFSAAASGGTTASGASETFKGTVVAVCAGMTVAVAIAGATWIL